MPAVRPAEIDILQRRKRIRMVQVYAIATVVVAALCLGMLVGYDLLMRPGIEAGRHVAAAEQNETQGHLASAEHELRLAAAIKGDDYFTHYDLGLVLLKEGRYQDGLDALQHAATIRDVPTAHLYAGVAALALHRPAIARAEAQRGLSTGTPDPDLTAVLALADRALGRQAQAARELSRARSLGYTGKGIRDWIAGATLEGQDTSGGGQ